MGNQWTGMADYIERLRLEAEQRRLEEERKKREEEARKAREAAFRTIVPVGPPTQEQSIKINQPVQEPKPKPEPFKPITSLVKEPVLPKTSLSSPRIDTSTPEMFSTAPKTPTVSYQAPEPVMPPVVVKPPKPVVERANTKPLITQQPPNYVATAQSPVLPYVPKLVDTVKKATEAVPQAIRTISDPATPVGAVVDRFIYNQFERPQSLSDELLQKYAPGIYGIMKAGEYIGVGTELFLAAPSLGNVADFVTNLGQKEVKIQGKTLGEMWATGVRAQQIYNQQYAAWLQQLGGSKVPTPADFAAAVAVAEDEYLVSMAPDAVAAANASPMAIAQAIAGKRSMAHHGMPASSKQMNDMLEYPQRATKLRDQAMNLYQQAQNQPDPRVRDQLLWEAAVTGAQAKVLTNTHPAQLFDENANWWMALPAEIILDPTGLLDFGLDILKLTPKARRMVQGLNLGKVTQKQAEEAVKAGTGVGRTVSGAISDFVQDWKLAWQLPSSKAAVDTRNNFRTLTSLFRGFTSKEDLRTIIKSYMIDPVKLLEEGIPAAQLTSPIIDLVYPNARASAEAANQFGPVTQQLAPGTKALWRNASADQPVTITKLMGEQGGVRYYGIEGSSTGIPENQLFASGPVDMVRFGQAALADTKSIRSFPSLQNLVGFVDNLPSLQGEGTANLVEVASDLYLMLTRGAGQRYGVATMANVPVGAKKAKTVMTANGQMVVQYLGEKSKVLSETAPMVVTQANKMVEDFKKYSKTGQEYASNFLKQVGDTERAILSTLTLDSSLQAAINNAISNRTIAGSDGVWSFKGYDKSLEYIAGVNGGAVPYDEIAKNFGDLGETAGSVASMLGGFTSNIPVLNVPKKLRIMDERKSKAIVYARTHEESMQEQFQAVFLPAMTSFLKSQGWQSPKDIANAAYSIYHAGMKGGKDAYTRAMYDLAQGVMPTNLAAMHPLYEDAFGDLAKPLADLVAQVKPETLNDALSALNNLRDAALDTIASRTGDYVFTPSRSYYTKLDNQKQVAKYQAELQTVATQLQESYDVGVAPYVEQYAKIQQTINENVMQLVAMARQDPAAAGHIYDLWEQLRYLRERTHTDLSRFAKATVGQPGLGPEDMSAAMRAYRERQSLMHELYAIDAGEAIDTYRQLIADGGTLDAMPHSLQEVLGRLGFDENTVFETNKLKPGSYRMDPNFSAAIEAGRKGSEKFITQMLVMLQRYPSESGFDNFLSAMDDMAQYYHDEMRPLVGKYGAAFNKARALQQQMEDLRAAGKSYYAKQRAAENAWNAGFKLRNEAWNQYYDRAYARYQAASALIAQNGGALGQMPSFVPLNSWGAGVLQPNQPVEIIGRNLRDLKEFFVKLPNGKQASIPTIHMPPEAIAAYDNLSKNLYSNLAQQVGKLGVQLVDSGMGVADVDKLVEGVRTASKNPVFDAVRKDIANYAANPRNYNELGSDLARWYRQRIDTVTNDLRTKLPEIANRNTRQFSNMSMDVVKNFSNTMGPIFDNILYGANRAAEEMVSFSLIDFANMYGADVLGALPVPYAYWLTRQGKNMVERMMFKPGIFSAVARNQKVIQSNARKEGQPQRFEDAINTGLELPNGEELMVYNPVPKWMPFGIEHILNGWADLDRANQGYETALDAMEDGELGGFLNSLAGRALFISEMAGATGFSRFPWIQAAILAANGRANEINLSQFGYLPRMVGLGMTAATGKYFPGVNQYYDPYTTARDIANEGFGVSDQGQVPMAYGQADYQGRENLPEFGRDYPDADALWKAKASENAWQQFLFAMLSGFTSIRAGSLNPKEKERRAAQQLYTDMAYDKEQNPTGGRSRIQMLDEDSPNYIPGVATGQSAYAVIQEDDERQTRPVRQIDETVIRGDYFAKRDAITKKYDDAEAEMFAAHPEWATAKGAKERNAWTDAQFDAEKAENEALDKQYPSVAGKFAPVTDQSLYGANPLETMLEAEERLLRQAKENIKEMVVPPYPGDNPDATDADWDAYNAAKAAKDDALLAELTRLMGDREAVDASVFNRERQQEWMHTPAELIKEDKERYKTEGRVEAEASSKAESTNIQDWWDKFHQIPDGDNAAKAAFINANPEFEKIYTDYILSKGGELDKWWEGYEGGGGGGGGKGTSAAWDAYHAAEDKGEYLRTHPEFEKIYIDYILSKGGEVDYWWKGGEGGTGGSGSQQWSKFWDAYNAYGEDWEAKKQFMLDNPEFAKYYADRYGNTWWLNQRTARTFTPFSYSYSRGGGSSGYSFGGSNSRPDDIRRVDSQVNDPPRWDSGSSANDSWRKWLALGEVNLEGWRR